VVGGALAGRSKKVTQTSQPVLTPQQQELQTTLGQKLSERLANPNVGINVQPLKNQARTNINKTYSAISDKLQADAVRRGFGRSGPLASNLRGVEVARAGQFGDLEAQIVQYLQDLQLNERDKATNAAQQFVRSNTGTTSETQYPSNMLGGGMGGLNSALESLAGLYTLSRLTKGGVMSMGGGGGGDYGPE